MFVNPVRKVYGCISVFINSKHTSTKTYLHNCVGGNQISWLEGIMYLDLHFNEPKET